MKNLKRKLFVAVLATAAVVSSAIGFAACGDGVGDGTEHKHSLTLVEENAATCTAEGNTAYYTCGGCDKWFADENAETEIADKTSVVIAKTTHSYVDRVCPECGKREPTEGLEMFDRGNYYEVSGIGTATDTDIVIPEEYNGKPVTAIGKRAFEDCNDITSVFIPDGVTYIDWYAFGFCKGLAKVSIPDSVEYIGVSAFGNAALQYNEYDNALYLGNDDNPYLMLVRAKSADITSCTVNENTKFIGNSAFYFCTELESITIPDGLTSMIGWGAFYECEKLQYAEYDNALYLGNKDNPYLVLVKAKDTDITSCTVHGKTKFIYGSSFAGCKALESVTLPDGLISINYGAFHGCENLQSVNIPDGVIMLGEGAFYECINLTGISIPDSVKFIEKEYTFGYCVNLRDVSIGKGIDRIAWLMFAYCQSLTSVTIPDGVTVIDSFAFEDCTGLTSVTIPASVIVIEEFAFYGCSKLLNITIPDGVAFIGKSTFEGCSGLESITIPVSVTSIGYNAFAACSSLADIYFNGTKEQWKAIEKDSSWDNRAGKYTVHCTDGDIEGATVADELKFGVYKTEYGIVDGQRVDGFPEDFYVIIIRENGTCTLSLTYESQTQSAQGTWTKKTVETYLLTFDEVEFSLSYKEGKFIFPLDENASIVLKYSGEED